MFPTCEGPPPRGKVPRDLGRVASALARFWEGGDGPTHAQIDSVFAAHLQPRGAHTGNKQEKVREHLLDVAAVDESAFWELASELAELAVWTQEDGAFGSGSSEVFEARRSRLKRALARTVRDIDDHGVIHLQGAGVQAPTAETVPACREHIGRLRRAESDADGPLVIGSAKELLESTVNVVLQERGVEVDKEWSVEKRAKEAEKALGLHASVVSVNDDVSEYVARVLRSLHEIAVNLPRVRNTAGTGHGHADVPVSLPPRYRHMLVGAAITYSEMLLNTLQDPDAPWRESANE